MPSRGFVQVFREALAAGTFPAAVVAQLDHQRQRLRVPQVGVVDPGPPQRQETQQRRLARTGIAQDDQPPDRGIVGHAEHGPPRLADVRPPPLIVQLLGLGQLFGIQLTRLGQPLEMFLRHLQQLRIVLVTLTHRLRHEHAPQPHVAVVGPSRIEAGEIQVAVPLDQRLAIRLQVEVRRQAHQLLQCLGILRLGQRRERLPQLGRRLPDLHHLGGEPFGDVLPGETGRQRVGAVELLPGSGEGLWIEMVVGLQEQRRDRLPNVVMLDEPPHVADPAAKFVVFDVRTDEFTFDQLQQLFQRQPRCSDERIAVHGRKDVLEALPDVALRRILGDVLRQVVENRTENRPGRLAYAPDSKPLQHLSPPRIAANHRIPKTQRYDINVPTRRGIPQGASRSISQRLDFRRVRNL